MAKLQSVWTVQSPETGVIRFAPNLSKAVAHLKHFIVKFGQKYQDEYFVRQHYRREFKPEEWARVQERIKYMQGRP